MSNSLSSAKLTTTDSKFHLVNPVEGSSTHSAPLGTEITITQPDDWHIHLRDGDSLKTTVAHAANSFNRTICMPNLVPPVINAQQAIDYRLRILESLEKTNISNNRKQDFDPRMTLYLTDNTTAADIIAAKQSGVVQAVKLYPAGATTNSDDGVTDLKNCYSVIEELQKQQIPLLLHGEVTDSHIDVFDREKLFLDTKLTPLLKDFPELKLVLEHVTTKEAAEFVVEQGDNIAATITPQHLLFNRNHLLVGGIKPHFYCLPILKRNIHQHALLKAATSGNPKFFIGTDSAPHATHVKENTCGCAGCYSASIALPLYASAFDAVGEIDKLDNFAGIFGAKFYGLPVNDKKITLVKSPQQVPASYDYLDNVTLTPLMAGETLNWSIK